MVKSASAAKLFRIKTVTSTTNFETYNCFISYENATNVYTIVHGTITQRLLVGISIIFTSIKQT